MKIKDPKKINIMINGDESDREEIIYNNIISNLNLTTEEQLAYLKNRNLILELELKNRRLTALLSFISLVGITLGIILLIQNIYFLGILFILVTFIGVITRFYLMYKNMIESNKHSEFEKIEQLKKLLEERLK
jgi:hypothetical protein